MLPARRRESLVTGLLVIRSLLEWRGREGDTEAALGRLWQQSNPPMGSNGALEMAVEKNRFTRHGSEWGVLWFYGEVESRDAGQDVLAWWFRLVELINEERRGLRARSHDLAIEPLEA